jgi:hypothetical protein
VLTVAQADARIEQLRRDHRGRLKEILTDQSYPQDDRHRIPGVYFIAAHPVRRERGIWRPETFKIGESGDPYSRLRRVLTDNAADLELLHVMYEPDKRRRLDLEDEMLYLFRDLAANGEWFYWNDDVRRFLDKDCAEKCGFV